MIRLVDVLSKDRELLWNIHQKYLYEMTNYYDDEIDEKGNYSYKYFDAYFIEPKRKALFIYSNQLLVGFAMINSYSYINGSPDYVLAEFTIFPMYRRRHMGKEASKYILKTFKGSWEIKYNERNAGAKALWNKVTDIYNPTKHSYNDVEMVLSFSTN